jgi:sulfur carrier protein
MRAAQSMTVPLNGSPTDLPEGATVADAVAAVGAAPDGRGVAVAVDGEVISKAEWERRELREGESVEVVRAVQGG